MAFSGFGSKPNTTFGSAAPAFGSSGSAFGGGGSTFGGGASQSAFGSSGASGSIFGGGATSGGSAFGQPAQGGGSIFGQSSQPTSAFGGGSTFGGAGGGSAFGGGGTSAFGQQRAGGFGGATGGSTFGAPATTGGFGSSTGTSAFGQPSTGGSLFGGGVTGGSTFGGGGSAFGGGTQTGGFGSTSAFGGNTGGGMMGGGQMPPYTPTREQDGNLMTITHAITAMPQYQNTSFEELRFLDYQQGRKGGQGGGAAVGGSLFGGGGTASTGSVFGGGGSTFGAAKPTTGFGSASTGGSLFGGGAQSQSAFGQTSAFGASSGGSVFGSAAQSQSAFGAPSAGGSLFGGTAQSGSAFGSAGGGSAFGAASTSAFGGGSAFGAKPATSVFGQPSGGGSLFGGSTQTASAFGAPQTAGSLFGGSQAGAGGGGGLFGAKPAGSAFGAPAPAAGGGGLFGTSAPATGAGGGGLFGAAKPSTGSAFGVSAFGASQPAAGGGLFGAAKPATSGFGGGFGQSAAPTGGSLFGGSTASTGGGLFGSSTAGAGSAFGASTGGGLFGGSTFGASAATSQGSLFGTTSAGATGGMFGAAQQPPMQPLTATPGAQPYGNNALFSNTAPSTTVTSAAAAAPAVPPGQTAVGLRHRDAARKAAAVASPSYKSVPKSSAHIKPRGFSRLPGGKLSLLDGDAALPVLSPDVFVARHSVKHLTIESPIVPLSQSVNGNDISTDASFNAASGDRRRVTFGAGAKDVHANDSFTLAGGAPSTPDKSNGDGDGIEIVQPQFSRPTPGVYLPPEGQGETDGRQYTSYAEFYNEHVLDTSTGSRRGDGDMVASASPDSRGHGPRPPTLSKEGYFTVPSITELHSMSANDRSKIVNFVIGRSGIGQVEFLGQTDVNDLSLDDIVIFRPKEVVVYPEELHKPEVGEQLNKRSIVTLHDCLPIDKATMRPTTDPEVIKKLVNRVRRKTGKMGAEFIEFNTENGDWVFQVEHFSRYGLDDDSSSEEDENDTPQRMRLKKQQQELKKGKGKQRQLSIGKHDDHDGDEMIADPDASTDIMDDRADDIANMEDVSHARSENRFRATLDSDDSSDDHDLSFAPHESPIRPAPSNDVSHASGVNVSASDAGLGFPGFGMAPASQPSHGLGGGPSLPQQLGLDATSLRQMKSSLFGSGDGSGGASTAFPDKPSLPPASTKFPGISSGASATPIGTPSSSLFRTNAMDTSGISKPAPLSGGIRPRLERAVAPVASSPGPRISAYGAARTPGASQTPRLPAASVFDTLRTPGAAAATPATMGSATLASQTTRTSEHAVAPRVPSRGPRAAIEVPLADSVARNKSHLRTDAGLFMGRSFRPSWCSGNRVISPVSPSATATSGFVVTIAPISATASQTPGAVTNGDESMLNTSEDQDTDNSAPLAASIRSLAVHLANSAVHDFDDTGCPRFSGLPTDQRLYPVMDEYMAAAGESSERAAEVWKLVRALWGDTLDPFADDSNDSDSDGDDAMGRGEAKSHPAALKSDMFEGSLENLSPKLYAQRIARRSALSRWLQEVVARDVKATVSTSGTPSLQRIFALLTGRNINEAVGLATQERDHRLALLLAQAGSAGSLREDIAAQREVWDKTNARQFIHEDRERIYALLAGDMSVVTDLDWRRAFAAHLWYGCEPHASITDVIGVYDASFQHGNAPFPAPSYHDRRDANDGAQPIDLAYHLLHLYSSRSHSLTKALLPSSAFSHPLEYGQSWHLYMVLEALSYPALPHAEQLHLSFAQQLELAGLWEWAVYVLLYLPNNTPVEQARRAQAIQSVLERFALQLDDLVHLPGADDNQGTVTIVDFLTQQLQIPHEWIAAARVIAARYAHDASAELTHLIDAGEYNDAHALFVKELGPRGILRRDDALATWLDLLSKHAARITHWQEGGSVYTDYLAIVPSRRSVPSGPAGIPTLIAIQRSLVGIAQRISRWTPHDAVSRIAFTDISTQVAVHLRQVGELIAARRRVKEGLPPITATNRLTGATEGSSSALPHLAAMPIPSSYRARELDLMSTEFVSNLFQKA